MPKVRSTCPYCGENFTYHFEQDLKKRLNKFIIKPHPDCDGFVIYVDATGSVRQTVVVKGVSLDEYSIPELHDIAFYHVKSIKGSLSIKKGNVKERVLLGSSDYTKSISEFLGAGSSWTLLDLMSGGKSVKLSVVKLEDRILCSTPYDVDLSPEENEQRTLSVAERLSEFYKAI